MLISLNWIRDFCSVPLREKPTTLGSRFSLHTAEVESVLEFGAKLRRIVVARVESVSPHPEADRLQVVRADLGGKTVSVVCGAPNVRPEQLVPYAPPGVTISGQKIEARKIRGVQSAGMLCSQKELEISADGAGLWELPEGVPPGTPLLKAYSELQDVVLEVDNKSLTHRPDLWGHYGIAREFATIYRTELKPLEVDESLATAPGVSAIAVEVAGVNLDGDPGGNVGGRDGACRRYCGLQIDSIQVAPSPAWLQNRLLAVGSRPINNIVDVTNYILFELGQPLHAFDSTLVKGGKIVVRRACQGERIELLDDTTVELQDDDLVIADGEEPVALAGVMGGAGTEISHSCTSVFLECANFAPTGVRRTSRRSGKVTDSSLRFEKSLDPEVARVGILRAAKMILELCPGAKVVGPLQDVGYEPAPPIEVQTNAKFLTQRLGARITTRRVRESLERLGFGVQGEDLETWTVSVPSWRATKDVSIEEDLVEEVGRIYGYDNIKPFAPSWPVAAPGGNSHRTFERRAKSFLTQYAGLSEVFTYSMVGRAHCERFGLDPDAHLKLKNPVSEDMDRLRREIVPIHIEKGRDNQRFFEEFGFFEVGRVYRKECDRLRSSELPDEKSRLAGLYCFAERKEENFYQVRGMVLRLLLNLGIDSASMAPLGDGELTLPTWIHPTVVGRVTAGGSPFGLVYRVHPMIVRELKCKEKADLIAFDIAFDDVVERAPKAFVDYSPPLRYPTVPFEVTVVAEARVLVRDLCAIVEDAAGEALLKCRIGNVYAGVGEGKKAVNIRVVFGSSERTLSGEEVSALQTRVIGALGDRGFPLR